MSSVVVAIDDGGQDAGFIASSSINQIVVNQTIKGIKWMGQPVKNQSVNESNNQPNQ